MTDTLTLAELAEKLQIPPRTIKFWTDRRVIRALTDFAGRGIPRQYDLVEARVASLLWPFAEQGLTIGSLAWLGEIFRRCLVARDPDHPDSRRFKSGDFPLEQALNRAIAGEGEDWLAIADSPQFRRLNFPPQLALASEYDGLCLRLADFVPKGKFVYPDGAAIEVDRGAVVVLAVNLTARLSLLR